MGEKSYWTQAVSLVTRTLPFIGVNAAVYGAFFVLSLIWFGIWGGLAFLFGKLGIGVLSTLCVIVGFGAGAGVVKFAQRYLLYMVKGAHIAAMTELLKNGTLPDGMNQYAYGKATIEKHFKDVSILYGVDTLVTASLRALQRKVLSFTSWLPLPDGARDLVRMVTEILNRALGYVDEAILSYAIYRGEENIWDSARHGIILYAQSYKPILITAAKVWVLSKVIGFVLFAVFMIPAVAVLMFVKSVPFQIIAVVLAFVASWAFKAALFEPFALAYNLVTFHHSIVGQVPDPEWDERLGAVSSKYRELVGKARDAGQRPFTPAPAPRTVG
ncbi:MAG: hypothetical protein R3E66_05230 [bacterium]